MANANMITAVYNNPAQTINSTSETVIVNAAGTPFSVVMPPNANVDGGRAFRLRCYGTATGGTSATLLLKFYTGTSTTVGSDTAVAAFTVSGAAIPSTGGNFDVYVDMTWDSTSKIINGFKGGHTNGTLTSQAAITAVTGISLPIPFLVSATFGAALSTNTVTATELSIEQL